MNKNFLLKCGSSRYFSGSLAVFEERGEPVKFFGFSRRPERSEGRKSSELI